MNMSITRRGLECSIETIVVHEVASIMCCTIPHCFRFVFEGCSRAYRVTFYNNGALPWF